MSIISYIIWSANPSRGPKAPIGDYKVRMKTNDYDQTYDFKVKMDPNLKGITNADLEEQFDLANKIMNKTSAANEAVIRIRKIRGQINSNKDSLQSATYDKIITPLLEKMATIEQDLYQVKNQSGQDPLNFPIKLNNRLASLRRSVEDGDAKPTDGAYKVFKELSQELDQLLEALDQTLNQNLPKVNSILKDNGLKIIE